MDVRRDRHVLCPVDFSDASRRALRYATAFAARTNSDVTVLYVNDPLLSSAAAAAGYERLDEWTMRELRRFAASAVGAGAVRKIDFALAVGDPSREIAKQVRLIGAKLVVMATHGLRGPKKLLIGSTAERTLRSTIVPVLTIPHRSPRKPRRWPAGPVVAGIDLGPESGADVRVAATIAQVLETELLLVHVLPPLRAPAWLRLRSRENEATQLARARSRLAQLATVAEDVEVSFRVVRGDPAPSLGRIAHAVKAAALMLVLRQERGLFGMARGTVTYHVLTSASTPVLAMPESLSAARLARDWS